MKLLREVKSTGLTGVTAIVNQWEATARHIKTPGPNDTVKRSFTRLEPAEITEMELIRIMKRNTAAKVLSGEIVGFEKAAKAILSKLKGE